MTELDVDLNSPSQSPELIAGASLVGVPLVLTAVRCTLQYIVVPLLLPLVAASSALAPLANAVVGLLGLGVILFNLTRLWNTSWRTRYLVISAVIVPFVLISIYFDYLAYAGH